MPASGLRTSWATPASSLPSAARRSLRRSSVWSRSRSAAWRRTIRARPTRQGQGQGDPAQGQAGGQAVAPERPVEEQPGRPAGSSSRSRRPPGPSTIDRGGPDRHRAGGDVLDDEASPGPCGSRRRPGSRSGRPPAGAGPGVVSAWRELATTAARLGREAMSRGTGGGRGRNSRPRPRRTARGPRPASRASRRSSSSQSRSRPCAGTGGRSPGRRRRRRASSRPARVRTARPRPPPLARTTEATGDAEGHQRGGEQDDHQPDLDRQRHPEHGSIHPAASHRTRRRPPTLRCNRLRRPATAHFAVRPRDSGTSPGRRSPAGSTLGTEAPGAGGTHAQIRRAMPAKNPGKSRIFASGIARALVTRPRRRDAPSAITVHGNQREDRPCSRSSRWGPRDCSGWAWPPLFQAPPPPPDGPRRDRPRRRRRGRAARRAELHKAYDLLRRLRSEDGHAGKPEERLRDLTERATRLYREAVRGRQGRRRRAAHEYGVAAHDLARAVDHARNAARFDRPDPDLPPPPPGPGPEGPRERTRRDLRRAYDRIRDDPRPRRRPRRQVLPRRRPRPLQRRPPRRRGRPRRARRRARPRRRGHHPRPRAPRPGRRRRPRAAQGPP